MINSVNLTNHKEQRFRRLVFLTIIIIYLLILAGGIVRGTGSGMGCPDWPRCFGRWIPPTDASQLPSDYQKIYGAKLKGEIQFNALKTWIEYVNRLLGVLSGFFVLGTLFSSFYYYKKDRAIFWGSVSAFLLIGINGWLGSRVVATELAHYMITIHLMLAITVVFALLFVLVRSSIVSIKDNVALKSHQTLRYLLLAIILVTLGQIIIGTQVREVLDSVVKKIGYEQRENWIDNLTGSFYFHRTFSLFVLILQLVVIYKLQRISENDWLKKLTKALIGLVLAEIGTGVIMAYFGVPAIAQPIHLLLAIMMIGLQFTSWLIVSPSIMTQGSASRNQLVEV
ncbi:COX15/CtaA family protein [Spirosoma sp.]|uniref:COX15/CtaA family protein n=1 Tax=Spirosoma sp. TaxID=1899569 RepID=UPI003B3A9A05